MIENLLYVISCIFLIPVGTLFIQVVMSLVPVRNRVREEKNETVKIVVLIPAHNEELVIRVTIESVKSQLTEKDTLLVVADNCTDGTSGIARDLGAEVIERENANKRGKGYALDFGVNHIKTMDVPPEVMLVIDADCIVEKGELKALASTCLRLNRPVQALYLMYAASSSPVQKLTEFAIVLKNWVRPLGFSRLGMPCQLLGSGMAFPWDLVQKTNLASSNIVEDVQLGIDLAISGYPAFFYPYTKISSHIPSSEEGVKSQRKRWEHGHLSTILESGPILLYQGLIRRKGYLIALAVDLLVPPLALLVLLLLLLLIVNFCFWLSSDYLVPLQIVFSALSIFTLTIFLTWRNFGKSIITFKELFFVPVYLAKKIPLYFQFAFNRQDKWEKTSRKNDNNNNPKQ